MKKILVILDGASDLGVDVFGGRTPLEEAETPNLDWFAKNGRLGYMYPISESIIPESDSSILNLFGNDYKLYGRGVFEAVGLGFKLNKGDLAFRTNFGTIENMKTRKVIDRRAGRTLSSEESKLLVDSLNKNIKLPCRFEFKAGVQHRGALVFRGGFCDDISNIDTEWSKTGNKNMFEFSKALNDNESCEYSASLVNRFADQSFKILVNHQVNLKRNEKGLFPANMVFLRGACSDIPNLKKYRTWMSINSMPLEIGIAKFSEMENFSFKYPELKGIDVYENLYDGLNQHIKFAIKTIRKRHRDFRGCYIQFKETDVPGHDNKPHEKKKMIEVIDKDFFGFLREFIDGRDIRVVVTCDHSTPCKLKSHSADPVPVLVYDRKNKDRMTHFNERMAIAGSLGGFYGKDFMKKSGLDK